MARLHEEDFEYIAECHMFVAIRRKKENEKGKKYCFRVIIKNEEVDLQNLKDRISHIPGTWRIYKTVNARNMQTGRKELMKMLIEYSPAFDSCIDAKWRSILMKPECKVGRKLLIDIDDKDRLLDVKFALNEIAVEPEQEIETPNGWHLVVPNFDTRVLEGIEDIEIKRDDLVYVDKVVVEGV